MGKGFMSGSPFHVEHHREKHYAPCWYRTKDEECTCRNCPRYMNLCVNSSKCKFRSGNNPAANKKKQKLYQAVIENKNSSLPLDKSLYIEIDVDKLFGDFSKALYNWKVAEAYKTGDVKAETSEAFEISKTICALFSEILSDRKLRFNTHSLKTFRDSVIVYTVSNYTTTNPSGSIGNITYHRPNLDTFRKKAEDVIADMLVSEMSKSSEDVAAENKQRSAVRKRNRNKK